MKKMFPLLVVLVFATGLVLTYVSGKYNALVDLDERVQGQWSQVENQYQRRLDLVPNLVNTVQGASDFEQETLFGVVEARAKASNTEINVNDPLSFAAFQKAQGELSSALSRLLVTVERYPELQSVQNYTNLMAQLEGTENRIATERMRYNDTVRKYNIFIRKFPNNFFAGLFGFNRAQLFDSVEGADEPPVVEFENQGEAPLEAL